MPNVPPKSAVGFAQNIMYEAWDTSDDKKRIKLAREALPGAIEWIKEQAGITTHPKVGRNDPCPCGSGKKYKKCCGM